MKPVVLIAGYDRAPHAIAVAENLRRGAMAPSLIVIAYPVSVTRIRSILRSRGLGAILGYLRGGNAAAKREKSPLQEYLAASGLDEDRSLRAWAARWDIRCISVSDINSDTATRAIAELDPGVTVYTGGGILRRSLIEAAGRRVLNAHSGPLPAIRGMNACEWSLLLGEPLSVTMHLIDEGIDTGPQLERIPVRAQSGDTVDMLRERCVVAGIEGMTRHVPALLSGHEPPAVEHEGAVHRQCFVLAPALRELLTAKLPDLIRQQQSLSERP